MAAATTLVILFSSLFVNELKAEIKVNNISEDKNLYNIFSKKFPEKKMIFVTFMMFFPLLFL